MFELTLAKTKVAANRQSMGGQSSRHGDAHLIRDGFNQ